MTTWETTGLRKGKWNLGYPPQRPVKTCSLAIPSSPRERDTQPGSAFETLSKGPSTPPGPFRLSKHTLPALASILEPKLSCT